MARPTATVLRDLQLPGDHVGHHTYFEWVCLHCGRKFRAAAAPRRSTARTGQYGLGFTRHTAHKGLIRAQKRNHLRACLGILPGAWPQQSVPSQEEA